MIEKHFDVAFTAALALQEKQIQQNYRPYIAVHKWFARRPGTLFRALLLSEFVEQPLRDAFYRGHTLSGKRIADPFMGGGTPLLEANRIGCDVFGCDINPMSHWIVAREIEDIDLAEYSRQGAALMTHLEAKVGSLYVTRCVECGDARARVKYFLWAKTVKCGRCEHSIDLFPGYLIAKDARHTANVVLCNSCMCLNEIADTRQLGACVQCGQSLRLEPAAKGGRVNCSQCGATNIYPQPDTGPPAHRLFAIEYHCEKCRRRHKGRYFKTPDPADLSLIDDARARLRAIRPIYVPQDEIPSGDETDRLHRWGYRRYREMFNERQLLGLELSARWIMQCKDDRIQKALATNLSDLLRYQNMLCRYDVKALKSLDVFSVHGFPVGLIQCESNILGIPLEGGRNIGSGGWSNIIEKYRRAKAYCSAPFEIQRRGGKKVEVMIPDERISDGSENRHEAKARKVELACASATALQIAPETLDGVFTDPPYFGNVQYAELMDFCYVWLGRMFRGKVSGFESNTTRNEQEFTVNKTQGRDSEHFANGMASVFERMCRGLKKTAPLVFTYHHNRLQAYLPLASAILDAGLVCSAVFPCPAEMGGSIHINGTGSSIVDSVFVCRKTGVTKKRWLVDSPDGIARLVLEDVHLLRQGNHKATKGDIRCIVYGHLVRLAVWSLRQSWSREWGSQQKLECLQSRIVELGGAEGVLMCLSEAYSSASSKQALIASESPEDYTECAEYASF